MSAVGGFVVGALGWIGLLLVVAGFYGMIRKAELEQRRNLRRMIRRHVTRR